MYLLQKKNHSAENCFKKIESEKRNSIKVKETNLNCYGCGTPGYYRSNCPTCNKKTVINSPQKLDFNTLQTTIIGRDVPTVNININGLNGEAFLDTAARTNVASSQLFKKLREKGVEFQKVFAEIILADGIPRKDMVHSTIVDIVIGKRIKRIRFICLSTAQNNRTLLGIDFLEQAGIVMDLAQRTWHFKDDPRKVFDFKRSAAKVENYVSLTEANVENHNAGGTALDAFMSWFEKSNSDDTESECPNDYSPEDIKKIFEDSLPTDYKTPEQKDFFPPLKKMKKEQESSR
ncbi:uncharacterized protein LOC118757308 [Rhagoletis pomonella]|uniref:uncharacterized protein LOC118757308 n=1 Tax=Rhagoletis pomonella TaxID=28610 RepID=UPI001785945D|nr:uncharacterized protein LOC118757308 [Rhagoletis pomonella]